MAIIRYCKVCALQQDVNMRHAMLTVLVLHLPVLKGLSVTAPTGLGTVVALRHERLAALAEAFLQEKNSQSNR